MGSDSAFGEPNFAPVPDLAAAIDSVEMTLTPPINETDTGLVLVSKDALRPLLAAAKAVEIARVALENLLEWQERGGYGTPPYDSDDTRQALAVFASLDAAPGQEGEGKS